MSIKGTIRNNFIHIIAFVFLFCLISLPAFAQTTTKIISFNSSLFPWLYANVSVESDGAVVSDLPQDAFTVYENENIQTDGFEVVPPETGGGVRAADIVFLIDCSGSMGGEINDVRQNVNAFVNALAASDIDFRLGLVRFGYRSGSNPYIFNNGNLTDPDHVSTFQGFVDSLRASGWYEPGFLAVKEAILKFNFRPGAQKVFLLITDEDSDGNISKEEITNLLLANHVTLHAAARCSSGHSQEHYCNEYSIRAATGGLLFGVSNPYSSILDTIVRKTAGTYVITYKSGNPVFDNTLRTVEIFAAANGDTDSDIATYTPGSTPIIELDSKTSALLDNAVVEASSVDITGIITDELEPFVSSATLFYRQKSQPDANFSSISMSNILDNQWQSTIPSSAIIYPGLEFYITATDGQTTASYPISDPAEKACHIAVLPNENPVISHTPVPHARTGTDIIIKAKVTDATYNVDSVKLHYRTTGRLFFTSLLMIADGSQYSATIPGAEVTEKGISYYIEAEDDLGFISKYPAEHPEKNPLNIDVSAIGTNPVLFIPGIMGSRMYTQDDSLLENERWIPNKSEDIKALRIGEHKAYIKRQKTSDNDNRKDIIGKGYYLDEVYLSFVNNVLKKCPDGSEIFSYDWRIHLRDGDMIILKEGSTGYKTNILANLNYIINKMASKTGKVDIVTHSMGGLLLKSYLNYYKENDSQIDKIDKVIMTVCPQLGTPDAIAGLLHGSDMFQKWGINVPGFQSAMRYMGNNSPAAYFLLPAPEYFNNLVEHQKKDPIIEIKKTYGEKLSTVKKKLNDGGVFSYDELVKFVTSSIDNIDVTSNDPSTNNPCLLDNIIVDKANPTFAL